MYEASGTGESLTFDAQQESNAILLGAEKDTDITITGYENLNFINRDSKKTGHEGIIAHGDNSSITINNVKNINLGASREDLLNVSTNSAVHNGVAIHGFKGAVNIGIGNGEQATVDTLNIYSANVGILAQQSGGTSGSINIHVNDAVNVYADDADAIQAAIFATVSDGQTSLKIKSEGTITAVSNGYAAVRMNDVWDKLPNDGYSKLELIANGDVTLEGIGKGTSSGAYGIKAWRNAGKSDLTVTSLNGNVNITGDLGAVRLISANDKERVSGLITGNEIKLVSKGVNVAKDDSAAVQVEYSKLDIQGDKITIDAADENAINVKGNTGRLTFGDGKINTDVYINGYMTVTDGATATFAENTTTHVDSKYLTNEKKAFITTGGAGSVNMADTASIMVDGLKTNEKITVNLSDDETLEKELRKQVRTDNLLQDVTFEGNTMTVGTVDKATAAERLGGSALTNVALAATEKNMDSVTALITNNASDTDAVKAALNSAAGFSGLANVAHGTYTMNGLFSDAISGHLMNRQDQDVWAYGFHSKENVNGLSFGGDYDAQYNGVTAGVDLYKNGGTTAGVALTYGDSNVSGSNGFATTKSDSDYYGASIYGRFDRGSYALLGDISYMKGDHDVTQVNSGETITASPDSDSISVGVKALKDYAAGDNGVLTPYVGLRYLRLSTDDFTNSLGLRYEGDDQDLVIVPVGVNYTASISHGKWSVRPYAGIGYVWTAGDRSADQTVVVPGGADSFSYDTADSSSFIARVGVTTDCDDMSYGIGYSWQKGDSVSNNAWTLSASFRF